MKKVLITGGSGLIGTALTQQLLQQGFAVRHLSRHAGRNAPVPVFRWDVAKGTMDPRAVEGVDHIVHLSGAGIADKRWTPTRRKELHTSRVGAADLLRREVELTGTWPKTFISASGVNYYGMVTGAHIFSERDPPAGDFIGGLCQAWENAADRWAPHCRVVKLRTPVVLSNGGGALPKMAAPARWGLAAPLGSGKQWLPWVHLQDLVHAYLHAIRDARIHGAYNIAAPEQVRNRDFMRAVAMTLNRPFVAPRVPAFLLRAVLNGPAGLLLEGSRVSSDKIALSGFHFRHPHLAPALAQLLG